MEEVIIIGGGMAGLGAAYQCRAAGTPAVVYEQEQHPGGHAWSWKTRQGFIFDDGPHISFTKNDRIRELLAESLEGGYFTFGTSVNNYWQGYWIKHPAQCNLHGLPPELVADILHECAALPPAPDEPVENYEQWLVATYGRTFAETFPMQYGRKYHTAEAHQMSVDWIGPRLYRPSLKEMLLGALNPVTPDVHYVGEFRYPEHGGFRSFLTGLAADSDVRYGCRLTGIDARSRRLLFDNGEVREYTAVVSSMPLPAVISLMRDVPADITGHAGLLACTSCVTVNLGLDRRDLSRAHWTYIYDAEMAITRVSFPHMFSTNNAPPGAGSIQAEIYFSEKYRPLDRQASDYIEIAISELKTCGILREDDNIVFREARLIPYANVIFDLDRERAVAEVIGYLEDLGIYSCGRYGQWGYHWTDESFTSGEEAARKVMAHPGRAQPRSVTAQGGRGTTTA